MNTFLGRVAVAFVFIAAIAFAIRLLSAEDNWMCVDGQWVKHGEPRGPKPSGACLGTVISPSEKMSVELFFPNYIKTKGNMDCKTVYPVSRTIVKTTNSQEEALKALIAGPSEEEKKQGFFTNINEETALKSFTLKKGQASADFDSKLVENAGVSCGIPGIENQITQTLKQFPEINSVVITVNGRNENVFGRK